MGRRAIAFSSFILTLLFAVGAAADPTSASAPPASDDSKLVWEDDRPKFRLWEYISTGVVGAGAFADYLWVAPQSEPHWVGGILFDNAVRSALRLHSSSAENSAFAASDAVDVTMVAIVLGVDSFGVPLLRKSPQVSLQLTLMDLESYAFGSIVTFTLYDTVGRARPDYLDCQKNPGLEGCNLSPTASFPSGHTAEGFISAGLSCANHLYVPIYGSRLLDVLACARDLLLASTDGALRVMADRHWATDVLTGAALGFAFGYVPPTLLHYRASKNPPNTSFRFVPMLGGGRGGLAVVGSFM
jgi:membrane-associated phospholipid phosphatase